jgi:hypothetical protein
VKSVSYQRKAGDWFFSELEAQHGATEGSRFKQLQDRRHSHGDIARVVPCHHLRCVWSTSTAHVPQYQSWSPTQPHEWELLMHSFESELEVVSPRLHICRSEGRRPPMWSSCCGFIGPRCAVVVGNQTVRREQVLLTAAFVRGLGRENICVGDGSNKVFILSREWVTVDEVRIDNLIYWPLILSRLVTTLYRSLTQCSQSVTVFTNPFLATDYNTRTIKSPTELHTPNVTHKVSSPPDY